jgi:hypothetical protein
MSNFMKIRPVGAELFHADVQTDMTNLTVAFRKFANFPKNKQEGWGMGGLVGQILCSCTVSHIVYNWTSAAYPRTP